MLSNGERQRIAIARLLIHRPQVVILDDALSALEEIGAGSRAGAPAQRAPEATIVSLGQRPAPAGVHDRQLALERRADSAAALGLTTPALATAK